MKQNTKYYTQLTSIIIWRNSPQWVSASSFTRFLDHTHNDAPQSVELLWTSDQPNSEIST
jgi:hypothetical protein